MINKNIKFEKIHEFDMNAKYTQPIIALIFSISRYFLIATSIKYSEKLRILNLIPSFTIIQHQGGSW